MLSIDLGGAVRVQATFGAEPGPVKGTAQLGNGTPIPLDVTEKTPGVWEAVFTPPSAGRWFVRVESGPPAIGASEAEVKVRARRVNP